MIETERLQLIPCEMAHLAAFARGPGALGELIGATVPEGFPVFPEGFEFWRGRLATDPGWIGWAIWIIVERAGRVVVGDGGFKGPPDAAGSVEIGYAIVDGYRERGYATEAARGLATWAFGHPEVTAVRAETLADGAASMRVLGKLGMQRTGTYEDPEEGTLVRWEVGRDAFVRR